MKSQATFHGDDSPYIGIVAEKLFPTRHRTLAALRDAGLHLRAFCMNPECEWSSVLDTDHLIELLGPKHGSMPIDLVPILYCSQCGGKSLAITLTTSTNDVPEAAANHIRENWKSEPS